jgi:hypothetical protein
VGIKRVNGINGFVGRFLRTQRYEGFVRVVIRGHAVFLPLV